MKAIILAAGNGTRLAPIGLTRPKVLVPIANKPLLAHHIETVSPHVDEVIVVVGPNEFGRQISSYIQSQTWPISISIVIQEQPLGTANAYQAAASVISGEHRLLCLNGDDIYSPKDIKNLIQHDYAILGQPVADPEKWGILQPDERGFLKQIVEKPSQPVGNLANTGVYLISSKMFELYNDVKISSRGEYEITDTINLFKQISAINVVRVTDYWLPIGYPWHILQAHEKFIFHPIIGHNVRLGHNVVISGQTAIGDNVVLGDNATIHNSTIFSDVHIGSNCRIDSSIIGQSVVINADAVTESIARDGKTIQSAIKDQMVDTQRHKLGTIVGDKAIIGAHATLKAGTKVWPNIVIGDNLTIESDVVQ